MTTAFETTTDDVFNVAKNHFGIDITFDEAEKILAGLNVSSIEKAALNGDEMEQQTVYAFEAILEQMKEMPRFSSGAHPGM